MALQTDRCLVMVKAKDQATRHRINAAQILPEIQKRDPMGFFSINSPLGLYIMECAGTATKWYRRHDHRLPATVEVCQWV
jgi:hypothetical protein